MSGRGDPSRGPGRRVWQRVQIGSENEPEPQQPPPAPARATAPPFEHHHHHQGPYDADSNNRGRPEYANYAPRRRAHRPPYHAGGAGGGGRNGPQSNPRAPWQPEPGTHQRGGAFGRGRFRVRTMAGNNGQNQPNPASVTSKKLKRNRGKGNRGVRGVAAGNAQGSGSNVRQNNGGGRPNQDPKSVKPVTNKPRGPKKPAAVKTRAPFALTGVRQLKEAILQNATLANESIESSIALLTSTAFGGGGGKAAEGTNALLGAVISEVKDDIENQNTWQGKKDGRGIDFQLCHGEGLVYDVQFTDERAFKNNSWVAQLEKAVLYFTQAICKLPPLLRQDGKEIKSDAKKVPYQLEMQYQIMYKSRAQAFCLLQRYSEFWNDGLVYLALCPNNDRLGTLGSAIDRLIEDVKRNTEPKAKKPARGGARRGGAIAGASVSVKKWREETRAKLKRAEDYLLLQAILDGQNDNKLNRLMASFTEIMALRKERMVEEERRTKKTEPPPKDARGGSPGGRGASPAKAPREHSHEATNIFEKVDFDPKTNELKTRVAIEKNRTIFYEQPIAFHAAGRLHCGNCFRAVNLSKAVPCETCSEVIFCNTGCREVAVNVPCRHKLTCKMSSRVQSKLFDPEDKSPASYLAFQMLAYGSLHLMTTGTKTLDFREPNNFKTNDANYDVWYMYASVLATQKRLSDIGDGKKAGFMAPPKNRKLLADAAYLTFMLMKLANDKSLMKDKTFDMKPNSEETKKAFKIVYQFLWHVHRDPLANSYLGRRNQYAIGPFGSWLTFSCKPNVRRKFNPKKGRIEYQAMEAIPQDAVLTIGWGSKLSEKENPRKKKASKAAAAAAAGAPPADAAQGQQGGVNSGASTSAAPQPQAAAAPEDPKKRKEFLTELFQIEHTCEHCR